MSSSLVQLALAGFLLPALVVFVVAYRHALRHWLRPSAPLPEAAIASQRARLGRAGLSRRFHAFAIATAFASVSLMGLIAISMIGMAVAGTLAR